MVLDLYVLQRVEARRSALGWDAEYASVKKNARDVEV